MSKDRERSPQPSRTHVEPRSAGAEVWLLGLTLALALVGLAASLYFMLAPPGDAGPRATEVAAPMEKSREEVARAPRVATATAPRPPALAPSASAAAPDPGEDAGEPDEPEAEPETAAEGSTTPSGIGLFPPPGTNPPRSGIIVPEGFELPPGYVRHYQATDGGKMLPAILMFHPDYHPTDANGQPIELPPDRIVPPELAPKGMPIEMLKLPDSGTGDETP